MIGTANGGRLYETKYTANGFTPLVDLTAQSHLTAAASGAGFADDGYGGLQVVIFNNTQLLHARRVNGVWTPWGNVFANVNNPGPIRRVVMCAQPERMHIVAVTWQGGLYHTIRYNNGTWPWSGLASIEGQAGERGAFVDAGCAGDWSLRQVQVAGVTSDGHVWHTIRLPNGTWLPFGNVGPATGSAGAVFKTVAMAQDGGQVQFLAADDNAVWHAIRYANGTWAPLGYVYSQTGAIESGGIAQVSAAVGPGGANFTVLKISGIPHWTQRHGDGTWSTFPDLRPYLHDSSLWVGWTIGSVP